MGEVLPRVVFVLGPPGAGKGTQCKLIQEKYGFQHLSAGDLLRAERQTEGSAVAEKIEMHIRNGSIVPGEITIGLLHKAMQNSKHSSFLIDGFPRNEDNLSVWNRIMTGKAHTEFMLVFECPMETCVQRCLSRGTTSGRSDDNPESMKHRVETYRNSTKPIIDFFDERKLVRTIDGNALPEKVFADVCKLFDTLTASGDASISTT